MSSLTEQFTQQATPAWQAHPLYRYWSKLLNEPAVSRLEVAIYRPKEGLAYAPAKLFVTVVRKDGSSLPPNEYGWDPVANTGLIRLRARCVQPGDESMRFALMARDLFTPIETRVGDGYFNSVFLERLRRKDFAGQPKLSAMLGRVGREYQAQRGEAFDECTSQIENAVATLARDLVAPDGLGYPAAEADPILDGALAQYVDERFNVTNRELLGW